MHVKIAWVSTKKISVEHVHSPPQKNREEKIGGEKLEII